MKTPHGGRKALLFLYYGNTKVAAYVTLWQLGAIQMIVNSVVNMTDSEYTALYLLSSDVPNIILTKLASAVKPTALKHMYHNFVCKFQAQKLTFTFMTGY